MDFLKIKNIGNDEVELILYGEIVTERPWWSFEDDLLITPGEFLKEMEGAKNAKRITIRLNSGGGDVFAALVIYNYLKSLNAHITVIIDGICASAATVIAMAGDVVQIPKTALFMIHNPTVWAYSNFGVEELDKLKNALVSVKNVIIEAYKSKCSLSDEELVEMMNAETWLLGSETVEKGFADELLTQDVKVQNNGKFLIVNDVGSTKVQHYRNLPTTIEQIKELQSNQMNLALDGVKDKLKKENEGKEGAEKMIKNLEELKQSYPEFVNQIREEAMEEGRLEERGRIKDIESISNMVNEELLEKAKYEKPINAQQLAFENMQLESKIAQDYKESLEKDYKNSGIEGVGNVGAAPSNDEGQVKNADKVNRLIKNMSKDPRRGSK